MSLVVSLKLWPGFTWEVKCRKWINRSYWRLRNEYSRGIVQDTAVILRDELRREFVMDMYTLLYLKWITNKDLLYNRVNSVQCYVAAWMGRRFRGEWIHVCVRLSPFALHLEISPVAQMVKHLPIMQETWVWSLGWEDPLEKEMATHSITLAWKVPWM